PLDDPGQARRWEEVLGAEYERLVEDADRERPTLLDPYGASSRAEFFAVATECFFLQPAALLRRHKELYELLAGWYRQDRASRRPDEELAARAEEAEEQYAGHMIAECSQAIRLRPDYAEAWRHRAEWHHHLGELDAALADWTKVIGLTTDADAAAAYYER